MADKKMNDFATASDGAYIYAESASGEQIKISKADLASVVAGLVKNIPAIGSDHSTSGNIWFQDNYTIGHIVTVGQCYGSGFLYIAYGIKEEGAGNYISTTSIGIPKIIFIFTSDGLVIGSAKSESIPIGEYVEVTFN